MGKLTVGLVMHLGKPKRKMTLKRVDDMTGAAVARITNYMQRLQLTYIDIADQVRHIGIEGGHNLVAAPLWRGDKLIFLSKVFDLDQS